MLGFIGGLLHPSTWLFVASDRMAVSHHHDVLVFVVVGTTNEQLSQAPLDGTVSVCALADVIDGVDLILQGLAIGVHVAQLSHDDHVVTVVQRSRVPRQDAVTLVAHFLELIYEELGEFFDLANVMVGGFLSEGDTLGCVQHEVKIHRTLRKPVSLDRRLRLSQEEAQQRKERPERLHGSTANIKTEKLSNTMAQKSPPDNEHRTSP